MITVARECGVNPDGYHTNVVWRQARGRRRYICHNADTKGCGHVGPWEKVPDYKPRPDGHRVWDGYRYRNLGLGQDAAETAEVLRGLFTYLIRLSTTDFTSGAKVDPEVESGLVGYKVVHLKKAADLLGMEYVSSWRKSKFVNELMNYAFGHVMDPAPGRD